MFKNISKARIGSGIYTRELQNKTRIITTTLKEPDGSFKEEKQEQKYQEWSAWEYKGHDSISLAKKANGRGSITFDNFNELKQATQ